MKEWMTAAEIAGLKLPGLPATKRRVNDLASRETWERRERSGRGGGFEYRVSSLPAAAQRALATSLVKQTPAQLPAQLDLPLATDLKAYQRDTMVARTALLARIDEMVVLGGLSQGKAVIALVDAAAKGQLAPELQKLVPVANARSNGSRSLTRATVYNWLKARAEAAGKVVALAPSGVPEAPIPPFAETLQRLFNRPTQPGMAECLERWPAGEDRPSYDQLRRWLKKVSALTRNAGRLGPKALQQYKAFIARDTDSLWPGAVFIGDGHTFKAEVAHPFHGRPFRPEITSFLDVYTRRWVGWSVALAENTWSVADALRHAVTTTTCCDILYYDNGAGAKNNTWDDALVGLAARLSITKFHSAPWSSQARGVIERF
ncbi:DNA-binding protein, partial [Telmatospirillum sp.]|uniref:DNA-binding protein n=1 Tax=Telmatospirillum sp. TaxID=2079197 RepID=UPI00283C5CAB